MRQDDPLSLYLFIMVADLLGRFATKAETMSLLEGFFGSNRGPVVPFIQFADDSLFMINADLEGLQNLQCILLMVEVPTSLKVNWSKSSLSPVGDVPDVEYMASVIGCDVSSLPINYLGLPLSAKPSPTKNLESGFG